MHHKRRRPKNRRAGCLLCKPHKGNGSKGREAHQSLQVRRFAFTATLQLGELGAHRVGPLGRQRS